MRLTHLLFASAILLAGCRTAGPQLCIRDSHHIQVSVTGDLETMQGKSVNTEGSLAASAAATLRDLTAAQGDATRTGESGESANAADAGATGGSPSAAAPDPGLPNADLPLGPSTEDRAE